jgi:CheY-like chemotaxis protein
VTNGKEAAEAVKQGGFAAVLMDAQMPKMDGFEATRQIRQWEQTTGSHITIIAMTASAMSVDREKCLAAGMDDYLSKPVTYDKLGSVLSKWIEFEDSANKIAEPSTAGENAMDKQPSGENLQFAPDTSVTAAEPIDIGSLEEMVGAEEAVEILNLFVSSSQELLDRISGASTKHDGKALREAAHELKGACASIGASNMARTCQELENAVRNDEWDMVPNLENGLSQNFQLAKNYIEMKLS